MLRNFQFLPLFLVNRYKGRTDENSEVEHQTVYRQGSLSDFNWLTVKAQTAIGKKAYTEINDAVFAFLTPFKVVFARG